MGGVIAPNAGTLIVGGLSLDSATSLYYTLGSTSGLINASGGSVSLGNAILDITAGANFTGGSYMLISNASSIMGSLNLTGSTLPLEGSFFTYGQTAASGTVTLNVTRLPSSTSGPAWAATRTGPTPITGTARAATASTRSTATRRSWISMRPVR